MVSTNARQDNTRQGGSGVVGGVSGDGGAGASGAVLVLRWCG